MTQSNSARHPDTHGVPGDLYQFNRTLSTAGLPGSALELLASFDDYTNQPGPAATVVPKVPLREVGGWRVTADVYRPAGEPPFATLLYLHGGAWVLGAPASHRRLAADLAALGLLTVVLDYRRAPKHRFPAAVDDTSHALEWLRDHAAELGGDPDRILVGGDSAGANLAAAALASGKHDFVSGALLLYGIYDVHRAMPVLTDLVGGPDPETQLYLEPDDMRRIGDDPRLHPERHCDRFPPSLVLVGADDPLHHESASLAAALTEAGVGNRYLSIPDAPHGFMQMPTHPAHARGLSAIEQFVAHTYPTSPGGTHR
ncbi:esterase/lipase [Nocardia nova SH22a]|uniref:Esterase/lipase n=1 Tax=Nocardia nova SH22a TaxID=1415166 RepID=W5TED5_9NOCA|nr:alpha/beta hydrolase fold domain-containing protein [Nocardia nova]AHH17514.1 esterase/lipase [Nocardia nova SH22a]